MSHKQPRFLAVDANAWGVRAVITNDNYQVFHTADAKTKDLSPVLALARTFQTTCDGKIVIGNPLDTWPPELEADLVNLIGFTVHWLPPQLTRQAFSYQASWNDIRKLHRARFFAYLYQRLSPDDGPNELRQMVADWEYITAEQTLSQVINGRAY